MRLKTLSALLLASGSLSACATFKPPAIDYDNGNAPAALDADPPRPVKVVALRTPLPLPGQLKPLPTGKPVPEPKDAAVRVATANEAARVQPTRDGSSMPCRSILLPRAHSIKSMPRRAR